jgi:phosphodiesterase/alkaline phosphatase D-like protein
MAGLLEHRATRRSFLVAGGVTSLGVGVWARPAWAPPKKPVVTTGAASNITATGARLAGTVNPKGSATTYHFQYGTTTAYGSTTPPASAGSGNTAVAVTADVGGLAAGTLYHFRISATNAGGTSVGADATFTTTSPPTGGGYAAGYQPGY